MVRDSPEPMTSSAVWITAPSMHPPDTDPAKSPLAAIAMWLPARRGADPQVRVTVASATRRPSFSHASACARTGSAFVFVLFDWSMGLEAILTGMERNLAAAPSDELQQAVIRDHFRRPRNRGALDPPAASGHAHNPFCGDTVRMWARVENGRIVEVTFDGRGCAISQAGASMLTTLVGGREVAEVADLRKTFAEGLAPDGPTLPRALGDLRALAGVRRFPSRVRCAVLPFEALEAALSGD